ncbi:MAG TPA: hypothetical protein VLL51_01620, partial [Gemmatimonadales bacterium]|nr:hypothetical protein [Gemmatimonadales bacterium]
GGDLADGQTVEVTEAGHHQRPHCRWSRHGVSVVGSVAVLQKRRGLARYMGFSSVTRLRRPERQVLPHSPWEE